MARISRFDCASSSLMLKALVRKTQRILWICLGLGIIAHTLLMQIHGFEAEQKVVKPLTTQFIKRQPRLSKPLELKKRPQPKHRRIQRKMVSVKAKMQRDQRGVRFQPMQVLKGLAKPSVEIGRIPAFGSVETEPRSVAGSIEGTKEVEQKVDMSLELLDIDALNTGQYHAMVIQDPIDKRNIRGFFHVAVAYSREMRRHINQGLGLTFPISRLVQTMNRYTNIKTDIVGVYELDSRELFKTPFIFFSAGGSKSFWVTESDKQNLAKYLTNGGFVFADNDDALRSGPVYISFLRMFEETLLKVDLHCGRDWTFELLPNTHALYHCYFDFDGAPFATDNVWASQYRDQGYRETPYLEGITLDGRLVVVFSCKDYTTTWVAWGAGGKGWGSGDGMYGHLDNTRQLQFGVNLIIFALTQEGSITHRLMDSIK